MSARAPGLARAPESRYLTDRQLTRLLQLAVARPDLVWPADRDISRARNAHFTNTAHDMTTALSGEFDWLEGDVRIDRRGELIMAHNAGEPRPMTLDEWIAVGRASGRGLKLDIKVGAALAPALGLLRAHGVDSRRLIVNVTAQGGADETIRVEQLARIRALFPEAVINLSANAATLTDETLVRLQHWASVAGAKVMFPLRWDLVDERVVRLLRPFGRVAIWNTPAKAGPADVAVEVGRLRRMGVDGMIDLRRASLGDALAGAVFSGLVGVLGWETALDVVERGNGLLRVLDQTAASASVGAVGG